MPKLVDLPAELPALFLELRVSLLDTRLQECDLRILRLQRGVRLALAGLLRLDRALEVLHQGFLVVEAGLQVAEPRLAVALRLLDVGGGMRDRALEAFDLGRPLAQRALCGLHRRLELRGARNRAIPVFLQALCALHGLELPVLACFGERLQLVVLGLQRLELELQWPQRLGRIYQGERDM